MAVYFRKTDKKPDVIEDIKRENETLKAELQVAKDINASNMIGIMELANRVKELEAKKK